MRLRFGLGAVVAWSEWREDKSGLGCFSAPKAPSGVWTFRELFRARGKARRLTYCCGQTGGLITLLSQNVPPIRRK